MFISVYALMHIIMLALCRLSGVVYIGLLSLSDTHRLIAESFALVNSSLSEGVATAVLEVPTTECDKVMLSDHYSD